MELTLCFIKIINKSGFIFRADLQSNQHRRRMKAQEREEWRRISVETIEEEEVYSYFIIIFF